jgi:hypothetical protein
LPAIGSASLGDKSVVIATMILECLRLTLTIIVHRCNGPATTSAM